MCTRINQFVTPGNIQEWFDIASDRIPSFPAHHNNAINTKEPQIITIRQRDGERVADIRRWGLVPHWCRDPKDAPATHNVRSETMKEKASFKTAWNRGNRLIIPVAGIYEWPKPTWGPGTPARFIFRRDGEPMLIAGLWWDWKHRTPDGAEAFLPTFTMNTTEPNGVLKSIPHDRMVCILDRKDVDAWLDPENEAADQLLRPCPDSWLDYYVTTGFVNKCDKEHQGPGCIEKGPPGSELPPPPKASRKRGPQATLQEEE